MWYKNTRAQNLFVLMVFSIGLLGSVYALTAEEELSQVDRENVYAQVFEYLFEHNHSMNQGSPDVFFLAIYDEDPPPRLLRYFSNHTPVVLNQSSSYIPYSFTFPVVLKKDHSKAGITFNIVSIHKRRNGHIVVEASFYEDRGSSAIYEIKLKKRENEFVVLSAKTVKLGAS